MAVASLHEDEFDSDNESTTSSTALEPNGRRKAARRAWKSRLQHHVVNLQKKRWLFGVILATFLLVFVLFGLWDQRIEIMSLARPSVYNRTLGFEKVFVINMPGRPDKRDAMTLAAAFSGIHVEWSDGVDFDDMESASIPTAMADMDWRPSVVASWRAHLNVLSRIVYEDVETALILEDDSDWDVNLKPQLDAAAQGFRELQSESQDEKSVFSSERASYYGDNWDILWLGHCRAAPSVERQDVYMIHNDSTVPPVGHRHSLWQQLHVPSAVWRNDTRILFKAFSAGCTMGYAVTKESAAKIVSALSLAGDGNIYDVALSLFCRGLHIQPFNCYSLYPPLISSHRFAGSTDRDSDILEDSRKERIHNAFTFDIVYSAIQNVPRVLAGAKDALSQWPEYTRPIWRPDENYLDEIVTGLATMELTKSRVIRRKGINMRGNEPPEADPSEMDLINHPDGPYKVKELESSPS